MAQIVVYYPDPRTKGCKFSGISEWIVQAEQDDDAESTYWLHSSLINRF